MNRKKLKYKITSLGLMGSLLLTMGCTTACGKQAETPAQPPEETTLETAMETSESTAETKGDVVAQFVKESESETEKVIAINAKEVDGKLYQKKTRVKTYLLMGVDSSTEEEKNEDDGIIDGQCDFLELLIIDQNNHAYGLLPINRNTITPVDTIDEDGNYLATTDVQICLAHAHGSGGKDSCENTVKAVSNLLDDISIDGYAALSLDSIGEINNVVGGVTVTIEDDFSQCDETLIMGETITLNDEQAVNYTRHRMDVADGTQANRMKRQKNYFEKLRVALTDKFKSDESFVKTLLENMKNFMVTDLELQDFSKIANATAKCEFTGSYEITGEVTFDKLDHEAFYPDEESLQAAILNFYYEPVED